MRNVLTLVVGGVGILVLGTLQTAITIIVFCLAATVILGIYLVVNIGNILRRKPINFDGLVLSIALAAKVADDDGG